MSRREKVTLLGAVVRILLGMAGGYMAYLAAPWVETTVFPIVDREYLLPFDPLRPDVIAEVQPDRVCWRAHLRRIRPFVTVRRGVTIILPDGSRFFPGILDWRTNDFYSNKDARPYGWEGDFLACVNRPKALDVTKGFKIDSYGEYETHGLWRISHTGPTVDVPPSSGDAK